jgi:hypothetical protein
MRRHRQHIRGVSRTRVCSGLVDLSMVIDHAAIRRQNATDRAPTRAEIAVRAAAAEPIEYARLCAAWESATKGASKRTALASLRAHENRHGRMPFKGQLMAGQIIDVSTGSESWLEAK